MGCSKSGDGESTLFSSKLISCDIVWRKGAQRYIYIYICSQIGRVDIFKSIYIIYEYIEKTINRQNKTKPFVCRQNISFVVAALVYMMGFLNELGNKSINHPRRLWKICANIAGSYEIK